jgi:hypothetical protein
MRRTLDRDPTEDVERNGTPIGERRPELFRPSIGRVEYLARGSRTRVWDGRDSRQPRPESRLEAPNDPLCRPLAVVAIATLGHGQFLPQARQADPGERRPGNQHQAGNGSRRPE